MPTKHKRKRAHDGDDKSQYDLPPTSRAKPLPVIAPTKDFLTPRKKQKLSDGKGDGKSKGKRSKNVDDTPKTFARLMAWHRQGKKLGSGLDNGETANANRKKKQKQQQQQQRQQRTKQSSVQQTSESGTDGVTGESQPQLPEVDVEDVTQMKMKILPGETLAEFGIRVDQSLPLSTIAKQNKAANAQLPADLRAKSSARLTKHNKRLARMQVEWRNTESKLRAKEEEELEDNEEKLDEERLLWDSVKTGKRRKKGAKVGEDDPWKELEKKRRAETGMQKKVAVLGVKDVVQAPPVLKEVKNMFKERKERVFIPPRVEIGKVDGVRRKKRSKDELAEIRRAAVLAARNRGVDVAVAV